LTTIYERSIRLLDKPLIPRDIIESDLSLQSYLEHNIIENRKDEKIRQRIGKAKQTWNNKRLEAAARKISVEPVNQYQYQKHPAAKSSLPTAPTEPQYKTFQQVREEIERKARQKSKKVSESESAAELKEPIEGSLVIETRKGIVVDCNNCGHRFTHFSKNLYSQYFCSCSRL
jgi:hypothetical protein